MHHETSVSPNTDERPSAATTTTRARRASHGPLSTGWTCRRARNTLLHPVANHLLTLPTLFMEYKRRLNFLDFSTFEKPIFRLFKERWLKYRNLPLFQHISRIQILIPKTWSISSRLLLKFRFLEIFIQRYEKELFTVLLRVNFFNELAQHGTVGCNAAVAY